MEGTERGRIRNTYGAERAERQGFERPTGSKGPKGEGFGRPTCLNFTNVPWADAAKVNISSAKTSTIKIFCRTLINSNILAYVGMSFNFNFSRLQREGELRAEERDSEEIVAKVAGEAGVYRQVWWSSS
jgi:hypothetical protein